jgi:hypothetical protein
MTGVKLEQPTEAARLTLARQTNIVFAGAQAEGASRGRKPRTQAEDASRGRKQVLEEALEDVEATYVATIACIRVVQTAVAHAHFAAVELDLLSSLPG